MKIGEKKGRDTMLGKKKTIFLGDSFEKYCKVKTILSENNIWYKEKIISHDEAFLGGNRGVGRSVSGINSGRGKLYELTVNVADFELAEHLINQQN